MVFCSLTAALSYYSKLQTALYPTTKLKLLPTPVPVAPTPTQLACASPSPVILTPPRTLSSSQAPSPLPHLQASSIPPSSPCMTLMSTLAWDSCHPTLRLSDFLCNGSLGNSCLTMRRDKEEFYLTSLLIELRGIDALEVMHIQALHWQRPRHPPHHAIYPRPRSHHRRP
jgi:Indoleamine 2,3-dioxygenase